MRCCAKKLFSSIEGILLPVAGVVVGFFERAYFDAGVSLEFIGEVVFVDALLFVESLEVDFVGYFGFEDWYFEVGA